MTKDISVDANRSQIPLMVAWGITVDRAMSQTMDACCFDARHSFVYTAITRVRNPDSMRILCKGSQLNGAGEVVIENHVNKRLVAALEGGYFMDDSE